MNTKVTRCGCIAVALLLTACARTDTAPSSELEQAATTCNQLQRLSADHKTLEISKQTGADMSGDNSASVACMIAMLPIPARVADQIEASAPGDSPGREVVGGYTFQWRTESDGSTVLVITEL